jgi:L-alanine-DL-glutamate epimerase-like enolase superfamily enzyme
MMSATFRALHLPFVVGFKHASAERHETSSVWVEVRHRSGARGVGEGCPRPYVTGETIESAMAFLDRHAGAATRSIGDVDAMRAWTSDHAAEIERNPAAWCALELAILDALARASGVTVDALLGCPPLAPVYRYTAVLGDAEGKTFAAMAHAYARQGFRDFKIKLSGDGPRDAAKLQALAALDPRPASVRVDANNLWPGPVEAIAALQSLGGTLSGIEEPVGARHWPALARIAEAVGAPVILDESVTRAADLDAVPGPAPHWIVNVRVSKMGGLLRSLEVVAAARRKGLRIVVGAQVGETSVLTRAALTVATAAGDLLVAQEGAFGTHLLTADVCDPPLMFGRGGVLTWADHPASRLPGLGIEAR